MIVVDAAAAVSALLNDGRARALLATEQLHAPHLVDSEVAHVIRREAAAGRISGDAGWTSLSTWGRVGLTRHPLYGLFDRIWELRHNVSGYDAGYVALAESLGCALVTADRRLSQATGIRCVVTVVPR